jgi:hypothetical protein
MSARRKRKHVAAAVVLVEPETIAKALKVTAYAVEGLTRRLRETELKIRMTRRAGV